MGTYLKPEGFQKRSFQEIRLDLEQRFRDIYGDGIDLQEEGRTGHLIGLLAKALADGWDGSSEIVSSLDPSQAEGVFLDIICALTGVFRIGAAKSRCWCICYAETANDGLLIPAGRQVRRTRGALVFSLRAAATVSSAACRDLYIEAASDLTPGASVTLTTSFGTFTVTVPSGSDPNLATYQALATAIGVSSWTGTATAYSGGSVPADAQWPDSCLRLTNPKTNFGLVSSATWIPALIGSVGDFEAAIYGTEFVALGEISEISTPEPGWEKVYNLLDGIPGRLMETDAQLRLRREQLFGTGNATERAILSAIYNQVEGVLSAAIRSNRNLAVDADGRPGKCFELTVQGGAEDQIGAVIWDKQPAGIESWGNQSVTVIDSEGQAQVVHYTIPEGRWLWADIRYTRNVDETFPANGDTLLREAILAWALTEFVAGRDVFPRRFNVPISTVPGVGLVQVRCAVTAVGVTPAFPGDYVTESGSILINGRSTAELAPVRLSVTEGAFL